MCHLRLLAFAEMIGREGSSRLHHSDHQFSREACVGSFATPRAAMHHRLPRFESRFTHGTICQI